MKSATEPSSPEAAQEAIKQYLERSLFDAPEARWRFTLTPTQGAWRNSGARREFGWFMCGQINGKNRMGGYTGYKPFFAYFSPTVANTVVDGTIGDTDDEEIVVDGWCKGLYCVAP